MSKKMQRPRPKGKKGAASSRLSRITLGDIGEVISEGAGAIRKFLNVETKRFDVDNGLTAVTTAGTVAPLSLIAEGGDYNQRDGRSIKTTAFEARLLLKLDPAKALADCIRIVFCADLENNGVTPGVTDILKTAEVTAEFQPDNLKRFLVFHDEMIPVDTYAGQLKVRELKMAMDQHIRFRGATGVAASGAEGQLYLVVVGLSAVASTSSWACYSRLSYVDN